MTEEDMIKHIPGADDFIKFYGHFPSFHDAIALELCLKRTGHSYIDIYTFEMTDKIDEQGYFLNEKEVIAHITCNDIFRTDVDGFNYENRLEEVALCFHYDGFELWIGTSASGGLCGSIFAREIFIEFEPITKEQRAKYKLLPSARPLD